MIFISTNFWLTDCLIKGISLQRSVRNYTSAAITKPSLSLHSDIYGEIHVALKQFLFAMQTWGWMLSISYMIIVSYK